MDKQNLELVKTRTIFLIDGEMSSELVLTDPSGDPMYFKFMLKQRKDDESVSTNFNVIDPYHAEVTITSNLVAITKMEEQLEIGDYNQKPLYKQYCF